MVSRYYSFYYIDLCISIFFWTLFKKVHCRGPCSLRPCISRPYCISQSIKSSICNKNDAKETRYVPYTLQVEYASLYHKKNEGENVISANLGPLFVTMTSMPFFYGADEFLQQGRCIPTLVIMAASCYPNGFNWNALPLIQQQAGKVYFCIAQYRRNP